MLFPKDSSFKLSARKAGSSYEDSPGMGRYIRHVTVAAFIKDLQVGYLNGIIVDVGQAEERGHLRRLIDCSDQIEDMMAALYKGQIENAAGMLKTNVFSDEAARVLDSNEMQSAITSQSAKDKRVFIIERLRVYPETQNQGFGTAMMMNLVRCKNISPVMFLKASVMFSDVRDLPDDQVKERMIKLKEFYTRFGFAKLDGSNEMVNTPGRFKLHVDQMAKDRGMPNIPSQSFEKFSLTI